MVLPHEYTLSEELRNEFTLENLWLVDATNKKTITGESIGLFCPPRGAMGLYSTQYIFAYCIFSRICFSRV